MVKRLLKELKYKALCYWCDEYGFLCKHSAEHPRDTRVWYFSKSEYYKDLMRHYCFKWGYRLLHSPLIFLYYLFETYYKVRVILDKDNSIEL